MNVATLLGLAVGIDYSLFMVGRFREELGAGRTVAEAVETTVEYAGRSIFFSGLTVVIGLLGPGGHPVHVDALDGAGRRPRRDLLGARRPDAAAGAAGHARAARGPPARRRALGQAGGVLGALVGRGHAPPRPCARRHAHAWCCSSPGRYCTSRARSPGRPRSRSAPSRGRATTSCSRASTCRRCRRSTSSPRGTGARGRSQPANLRRLFEYGTRLEAMPGVARVTSVVNLPGVETPAAAARFWRAVQRPAGSGPPTRRRRPSRPAPGPARRPAARGGAAPARAHHGSRHGALPGRPRRTPRPPWRRRISPCSIYESRRRRA